MGEAADLTRGLWPSDIPIGNHHSVTRVLPRFLSLASQNNLKATYFAESWNVEHYPSALCSLVSEGHEVAWHAFRHEAWGKLSPDEEEDNTRRSFEAVKSMEKDGVEKYRGFRPPGGLLTPRSLELLRRYGVRYVSPAGSEVAIVRDSEAPNLKNPEGAKGDDKEEPITVLPFKWQGVDAFYYMKEFAGLRKLKGEQEPERARTPAELKERLLAEIEDAVSRGGFLAILFHPFLNDDEERLQVMGEVLQEVARRRDKGEIWVARAEEVDEWVRAHEEAFEGDPGWDLASWR